MIRRFETRDLNEIMDLWLHANIESHSFIEADYWKKNYDMVRKLISEAEMYVAEENEEIQGFIGLIDTYIAGIFVKAKEQSNVYKKNMRAVVFYQHRGFKIVNQKIDENTSEEEYTMEWHR